MASTGIKVLAGEKFNIFILIFYIVVMVAVSPLIPEVSLFKLGDFTRDTINYYHTVMIPLALLLIIYASFVLKLPKKISRIISVSTVPLLILNIVGLVLFYPVATQGADYIIQGARDVWMLGIAFLFFLGLLVVPFRDKARFKKIWGAYLLVVFSTVSAGAATIMGMIYEYGYLYGFGTIPLFNSFMNSIGGTSSFLVNLLTSHSHEMLPAIMGGIVALALIGFGYENLTKGKRRLVNIGMVVSMIGTVGMTYIYIISSFSTYSIPTLFTSGSGGMNGLAFDDFLTGLIGVGALISVVGIYFVLSRKKSIKLIQVAELLVWVATVFVMIGIGYIIEFNEVYYGFGSPGAPPNGGAGYIYDMAYMNAHLVFAFFLMPVLAGLLLGFLLFIKRDSRYVNFSAYLFFAGILLSADGVLVYLVTLSWYVEAAGVALTTAAMVLMLYITANNYRNADVVSGHNKRLSNKRH